MVPKDQENEIISCDYYPKIKASHYSHEMTYSGENLEIILKILEKPFLEKYICMAGGEAMGAFFPPIRLLYKVNLIRSQKNRWPHLQELQDLLSGWTEPMIFPGSLKPMELLLPSLH